MFVAIAFTAVIGLLTLFQLALALGAPWGRFAWGGQYPGTLPRGYRIASTVSVLVYGLIAALALDRSGLIDVFPAGFAQTGMWVVFGFLCLGIVMNAISRSKPERFVMTPVSLVLAALALVIALTGPIERFFAGMVLDNGSGPVFCTTILESYPPQCGTDARPVAGWDWSAVKHEQSQSIRWGDYRFGGVQDDGVIILTGTAAPLR